MDLANKLIESFFFCFVDLKRTSITGGSTCAIVQQWQKKFTKYGEISVCF